MRKLMVIILMLLFCPLISDAQNDSFLEGCLQSTVAIGVTDSLGKWNSIGTGFLMYSYDSTPNFLVTNRHLFEPDYLDPMKAYKRQSVTIKTNINAEGIKTFHKSSDSWIEYNVNLLDGDSTLWTTHSNLEVDIAVIYFPPKDKNHQLLSMFSDIIHISKSSIMLYDSLQYGYEVFFLGFPLGLGVEQNPIPLMRYGAISMLNDKRKSLLIDAQVFGGSSGSPVFLTGSSKFNNNRFSRKLVGIVNGYKSSVLRFYDYSIQNDTLTAKNIKIPIENSGLGNVFSVDLIYETIEQHQERFAKSNK